MMKSLAMVCLGLAVSPTALPQQPNDWHPSIAEDNKAATWEDTSLFIVNSLTTHGHNYLTERNHVVIEKNFVASSKCSLSYLSWEYRAGKISTVTTGTDTLDFKLIDPLSVVVRAGTLDDRTSIWQVVMSGTSEGKMSSFVGVIHHHVNGYDGPSRIRPELLETACQPGQKNCEPSSQTSATDAEYFDDQELAKRFARAVLHAALLCGGTKAVSPF